jgi:hypothetical protein
MIRDYNPNDIIYIEELGKSLILNYIFKTNSFTKCLVYVIDNNIVGFISYFMMYNNSEIIDIAVKKEF